MMNTRWATDTSVASPSRNCSEFSDLTPTENKRLLRFLNPHSPQAVYQFLHFVGSGSHGVVRMVRHRETGQEYACKILRYGDGSDPAEAAAYNVDSRLDILREIETHCDVCLPGVSSFKEYLESESTIYIVTELLAGGDLLTHIADRGSYSEEDARAMFRVALLAVLGLHKRGIIHRDIKLENLILADPHDPASVKLVDFGLACRLRGDKIFSCCGTPGYCAPEVIQQSCDYRKRTGYGPGVDMWSLGVTLYILLAGYPPFLGIDVKETLRRGLFAEYNFQDPAWALVSDEAKSLIQGLLTSDPGQRFTPSEALAHPWLEDS